MIHLEFKDKVEEWNIYECDDGTLIKIKLVLTGVMRDPTLKNEFGEIATFTTWSIATQIHPPKPPLPIPPEGLS